MTELAEGGRGRILVASRHFAATNAAVISLAVDLPSRPATVSMTFPESLTWLTTC